MGRAGYRQALHRGSKSSPKIQANSPATLQVCRPADESDRLGLSHVERARATRIYTNVAALSQAAEPSGDYVINHLPAIQQHGPDSAIPQ